MIAPRDIPRRAAAWLICSLALLALAVACEIEPDLPPRAESVAVAPPPIPNPAEASAPDETATPPPAPTQEPTAAPEPTSGQTPNPESTAVATPELTFTPAPESTPHPETTVIPTPAPQPTPYPEPTSTPAPQPTPHPELTPIPTPALEPAATPELTITPAPQPTPYPGPTAAPGEQVGPIDAPAPAGSTVVTADGLALTITSFNPDAGAVLENENPYYEPPHEGNRFVMARARVQNVGGDANSPIGMENIIDQFYFVDSSSATVVDWRGGCDIFPNDIRERYAALFLGGTAEVSVCFEIPKSETDIALMYRPGHFYDKPIFLALANPDDVEPVRVVDANAAPPPGQAAGRSRFNPAPPGRQVESADGLMALTLVSVNPDADFSEFFYSYYEPSDRVAEGNRLVSARVRVQNVGGSVNRALIIEGGFALVGSSSVQFRDRGCRATRQDPAIFLGGIAEVDVCFETPESETDLVLIHTSPNPPRQPGRLRAPQLEKPRRYLAFANPDVVESARVVDAPLEPSPGQTAGHFRSSPAPPGASAYNPWGMAISIVSANLDAAAEILTENPTIDPPAEGSRFVAARARIEWVGGNASNITPVDIYPFNLVGFSSVVFSAFYNPCGALPDELPYVQLSGGEAAELDVCFEIPESETGLILFYGPPNDESTRWMRMPER